MFLFGYSVSAASLFYMTFLHTVWSQIVWRGSVFQYVKNTETPPLSKILKLLFLKIYSLGIRYFDEAQRMTHRSNICFIGRTCICWTFQLPLGLHWWSGCWEWQWRQWGGGRRGGREEGQEEEKEEEKT